MKISFIPVIVSLMAITGPVIAPAGAQEKFDGAEIVRPKEEPRKLPPNARVLRLRVGEILEVFSTPTTLLSSKDERAFYVPAEGNAVLQVVIEKTSGRKTYFVKGLAAGETIGGVVYRDSLDKDGYRPKNEAEHARIQKAVKDAPYIIVIETSRPAKSSNP